MAEGLVNHYFSDTYRAYSAGTERTRVKALAIEAMAEAGIDISHHTSQHIDDFMDQHFDLVVTVCDTAKETCPYFPNADSRIHVAFSDPSDAQGDHETKLGAFISCRNAIHRKLPEILQL
jgi:arsenate reductase